MKKRFERDGFSVRKSAVYRDLEAFEAWRVVHVGTRDGSQWQSELARVWQSSDRSCWLISGNKINTDARATLEAALDLALAHCRRLDAAGVWPYQRRIYGRAS